MNKLFYSILVAIFVPMILSANFNVDGDVLKLQDIPNFEKEITAPIWEATPQMRMEKKQSELQSGLPAYWMKNIVPNPGTEYILTNRYSGGDSEHNQFFYDPASNLIVIITAEYQDSDFETGEAQYRFHAVYADAKNSTEDLAWDKYTFPTVYSDILVLYPTGGIANRDGGDDIEDLSFVFGARAYQWDPNGKNGASYYYAGLTVNVWDDGTWNDGGDEPIITQFSPDNGADWAYDSSPSSVYLVDDQLTFTATQVLATTSTTSQYGVYGQASIGFPDYNMAFERPATWDPTTFYKDPNAGFSTTHNSGMFQCTDPSGNVYAGVVNMMADDNPNNDRSVAVSMSEDGGITWSEFNACPVSLLDTYLDGRGATREWTQEVVDYFSDLFDQDMSNWLGNRVQTIGFPYGQNAIVAFGPNDYSVFTNVELLLKDGSEFIRTFEITEFRYKDGTWTITPIAQVRGLSGTWGQDQVHAYALMVNDEGQLTFYQEFFNEAYSITATRTADGNNAIVAWRNYASMEEKIIDVGEENAVELFRKESGSYVSKGTLSQFAVADIFAANRSTDGEWKTIQVTDDSHQPKGLQFPPVVPSLNNALLRGNRTVMYTSDSLIVIPDPVVSQMVTNRPNAYYVLGINFDDATKYYEPVLSVNDNVTAFTLNTPYPNPANAYAEVSFSVTDATNTTVKVYDSIGNEVLTAQEGIVSAGLHGLTINTSALASGSYYVVLSDGNKTSTQLLNVVH